MKKVGKRWWNNEKKYSIKWEKVVKEWEKRVKQWEKRDKTVRKKEKQCGNWIKYDRIILKMREKQAKSEGEKWVKLREKRATIWNKVRKRG